MYTLLDVEVNTECGALNPAWGARYVNNGSKPRQWGQVFKQ